jgi:hypothetical protein
MNPQDKVSFHLPKLFNMNAYDSIHEFIVSHRNMTILFTPPNVWDVMNDYNTIFNPNNLDLLWIIRFMLFIKFFLTSFLFIFHFFILLLIKCMLKIYKHNKEWFWFINCMIMMMKRIMVCHFTIIFMTQNSKFYHSRKVKLYIILKNNYVYVDTMIVKYNFKIC